MRNQQIKIFGIALAPIAWLIGVEWGDAIAFGSLIGTKVVTNEFVAYIQLSGSIAAETLSPKTIVTFPLLHDKAVSRSSAQTRKSLRESRRCERRSVRISRHSQEIPKKHESQPGSQET